MPEAAATTRRFDQPDERRDFPLGRFELVQIGGMTVGRAEYAPGWRWSEHIGAAQGRLPVRFHILAWCSRGATGSR